MNLTYVVDGSVVAAKDKEGAGRITAVDGNHVLILKTHRPWLP